MSQLLDESAVRQLETVFFEKPYVPKHCQEIRSGNAIRLEPIETMLCEGMSNTPSSPCFVNAEAIQIANPITLSNGTTANYCLFFRGGHRVLRKYWVAPGRTIERSVQGANGD
jgi:hypothetical protein